MWLDTSRRLLTYFGTVVFVDPLTLQVRHGPVGSSPRNVALRMEGADGQLFYAPEGIGGAPIALFKDGAAATASGAHTALSGTGQALRIDFLPDGAVGLSSGKRYVAAEQDGRITLSRNERRDWETFLPLSESAFELVEWLSVRSWVTQGKRQLITPEQVRVGAEFRLMLGELSLDLRAYVRAGDALLAAPGFQDAPSISVLHQGWRAERLFLYKPLIYFGVFGDDAIFQCLEIALASLDRFAAWPGAVLILTDRAPDSIARLIPERFRPRLHIHLCNPGDVLGFTLARYAIGSIPFAHHHQPLLYSDADVVFDGDLTPLMTDILLADGACFLPERPMFDYDFYGEPLFWADDGFQPSYDRGLSSGAIGIPNLAKVADSFRLILQIADAYPDTVANRDLFCCYDQPFANYVFHKLGGFDATVLPRHGSLHHSSYADVKDRKGFVHFCGGVGLSAPKLVRMAQYYDDLSRMESARMEAETV
ncbi:MAG: hypothetical protein JOZ58_14200 [Acetobacteraceae bacterium]|nr:hypothetical protein [Acetobacteraceae bacterium]